MKAKEVKKIVLPVAGLGKRLRPLTLRKPKALVELAGRPLLAYVLEDAEKSGIRLGVLVVSPKHKDHFKKYIDQNAKRFPGLKLHIRVQEKPLGNGHAIVQAHDLLGNDSFGVRFCDDVLVDRQPVLQSLIRIHQTRQAPVVLLERVPKKKVSRYGVVGVKRAANPTRRGQFFQITKIIEKPLLKMAPSNLTIIGAYVLTPRILRNLKLVAESLPAAGNDALPIAVGFQIELIVGGRVFGWEFPGKRLDCGNFEGLKAAEHFLSKANDQ